MKKTALKRGTKSILHLLQHALIVTAAVSLLIVITGSSVMMKGVDGNYSYSMDMREKGKDYEESMIFNHILGRGVADVARMVAVRSQMETDGRFDGEKEIDIATFYYRYGGLPQTYITAKYRLEDLIKWAQYGFEYEERDMKGEEVANFLNIMTTFTRIDQTSGKLQGGIITPFNSDMTEYTTSYGVSANGLEDGTTQIIRDDTRATVLNNRYKTVDGKNIEELTGTWEDYYKLCSYVEKVASSLNNNYEEYLRYRDYYDIGRSNLRYYVVKTIGDNRQEVYTNLKDAGASEAEITRQFEGYGKYLYFHPADMKYTGNSLLEENTVRQIFNGYEYAFPETTKIWIGVDTDYPVNDVYIQGLNGYKSYVPYYWQLLGTAALCFFLYVFLFIYLTFMEGRERDKEGNTVIRLKPLDHVPTEITVIGSAVLLGGILVALTYVYDSMSFEYYYTDWFKLAAAAVVLVCELLFTGMYYSMVRRLKADNLWSESLTCLLVKQGKTTVWKLYDNGSVIRKTWLPYIAFLLVNLFFILFGRKGILIAFLLDMAFGVLIYRNTRDRQRIVAGIEKIRDGDLKHKVDETSLHGDNLVLAQAVNSIGDGIRTAVETSMKDERLKADLITNVSHDIKTPLTSIISYVDLIKRENITDEKIKSYVGVLDTKSQRLKQLTDDLVEASKISSGNLSLHLERINLVELVNQTLGEFSEKFEEKRLTPVLHTDSAKMYIEADSRGIWRVVENLFNNIFKYTLEGTRVYMDMCERTDREGKKQVEFALKNISAQPLNINASELTERFIRGDVARSTEGSGLGLSIARNLTEAQNGGFEILLDGDLFKVVLTFPLLEEG